MNNLLKVDCFRTEINKFCFYHKIELFCKKYLARKNERPKEISCTPWQGKWK